MPTITNLNKEMRDKFMALMMIKMQEVAKHFDVEVKEKGYTYDASGRFFEPKFSVAVKSPDGTAESQQVVEFKRSARMYGLEPEDFGREFTTRSGTYKILGLKRANRKYPILGECVKTGSGYKFTADQVCRALGK
jgi:hypothetical protein